MAGQFSAVWKSDEMKKTTILSMVFMVLAVTALLSSFPVLAETRYVSDQLTIPMRSGASNEYRILRFLRSGTELTVLSASEDGKYLQVQTRSGKKGWIEKKHSMSQPSARERIVTLKKQFSNVSQTISDFEQQIKALERRNRQLEAQYASLESEKQNLENAYEELKVIAANPLALSRTNKQLQQQLDQVLASEAAYKKENAALRENVMQDWFLIGGGVSMGSLLFGLLITRINWRRRRNSWGDSF